MMKLLVPLLSFLLGNAKSLFKQPGMDLTQQLVLHVRAATTVIVVTIGSLALSCVGISLLITSIAGQLDRNEGFYFSPGMILYAFMSALSVGVLIYSLRRETWLKALGFSELKQKETPRGGGALESALAMLVVDFVEERKNKRHKKEAAE